MKVGCDSIDPEHVQNMYAQIKTYFYKLKILAKKSKQIKFEHCTLTKKAANLNFYFSYKLICL